MGVLRGGVAGLAIQLLAVGVTALASGCVPQEDMPQDPSPSPAAVDLTAKPPPVATSAASTRDIPTTTMPATPAVTEASPTPTVTAVVTVTETVLRQDEPKVPGPITREVGLGSTVSMRYFDVTVMDVQRTGTELAAKIEVCYTHAHPEANADGTTRVSRDPWSFGITDPEGAQSIEYSFVKAREFPKTSNWTPTYEERRLSVGECNTGWLGIRHGNPDLWISYLRYSPADFGDRITWDIGG